MENDYFDDIFKEGLESAPEYSPTEADVQGMQAKLRAWNTNRKAPFPWWMLFWLLLLCLILSLFFSFFLFSRITKLESTLGESQNTQQQIVQIDTVYYQHIIQQIDTVHQTIYRTEYQFLSSTPLLSFSSFANLNNRPPYYSSTNVNRGPLELILSEYFAGKQLAPVDLHPREEAVVDTVFLDNPSLQTPRSGFRVDFLKRPSPSLSYAPASISGSALLVPTEPRKMPRQNIFQPESFSVGIAGSPLVFPSHTYGGSAFSIGGNVALYFPGNRALSIGGEWLNMNFEVKDNAKFGEFPTVTPANPDDELHEIKSNLSYLQIPLMVYQEFYLSKRIQPNIAAGWVIYRPLQEQITYEFYENAGEYKESLSLSNDQFEWSNLRFLVGLNIDMGRGFYLRPEFMYQYSFSTLEEQLFPLTYSALRFNVRYEF